MNNQPEAARVLLERGASPDAPTSTDGAHTPLHIAALGGGAACALALLAHGARADARTPDGLSPLHAAARNGHADVVRVLAEHGAAVDAQQTARRGLLL